MTSNQAESENIGWSIGTPQLSDPVGKDRLCGPEANIAKVDE